jgi:hypothetical protein
MASWPRKAMTAASAGESRRVANDIVAAIVAWNEMVDPGE